MPGTGSQQSCSFKYEGDVAKVIEVAGRRHVGAWFIRARPDTKPMLGTGSQQSCSFKYEG
jgi:hypothetical protein